MTEPSEQPTTRAFLMPTVRICRLLEAAAIQAIEKEHELINLQMLTDDLTTETLVSISDRRSRRTN